jgi:flagellar basal-body rod protein FlgB
MYEVAPAGNSVIIEEQLMDAGQNAADYNLMLNIMQKQVGMIRTALGN